MVKEGCQKFDVDNHGCWFYSLRVNIKVTVKRCVCVCVCVCVQGEVIGSILDMLISGSSKILR